MDFLPNVTILPAMTLRLYTFLTGLAFFWLTSMVCVVPESEKLARAYDLGAQIWDEIPGAQWAAVITEGTPVKGEAPEPPTPAAPSLIQLADLNHPIAYTSTTAVYTSGLWNLSRRQRLLQSPSNSPPSLV